MSTPIDNGGYAFPVPTWQHPNGDIMWGGDGMTLRDWFAGQALGAYLAGRNGGDNRTTHNVAVAKVCYEYADAMIEARKGKEAAS